LLARTVLVCRENGWPGDLDRPRARERLGGWVTGGSGVRTVAAPGSTTGAALGSTTGMGTGAQGRGPRGGVRTVAPGAGA